MACYIIVPFLLVLVSQCVLAKDYYPAIWKKSCNESQRNFKDNTLLHINLDCLVSGTDNHSFILKELKEFTDVANFTIGINIICTKEGAITMTRPMKIETLTTLRVQNCHIMDFINDWNNPDLENTKDSLERLEIIDSIAWIDIETFSNSLRNVSYISREWDCGHDKTLQLIVYRNFSMDFLIEDYSDIEKYLNYDSMGTGEMLDNFDDLNSDCDFLQLRELEESSVDASSTQMIRLMKLDTKYKYLEKMSFTDLAWTRIPAELISWYDNFPSLTSLNLSHNKIDKFRFSDTININRDRKTLIDLTYNNITVLTIHDLKDWAMLPGVHIDVRRNPIDCSCSQFFDKIKSKDFFKGDLSQYSYIREIPCASPTTAKGVPLGHVSKLQMGCAIPPEDLTVYLIILGVTALILIIAVLLIFKYRREIKIILYIRFNILLPWDVDDKKEEKKYDAFVSYSSEDEDWVLDYLQTNLETPSDSGIEMFNLCLHQRDFIGGKSIIDNIIFSIENSRHTVVILSKNFVNCVWAKQEFQFAFEESITKKHRHLILVKVDDVPEKDMDSTLKRCLKTFTYLEANDKMFLDRIRYALAIKSRKTSTNLPSGIKTQISRTSLDSGFVAGDDVEVGCETINTPKNAPQGDNGYCPDVKYN